MCDVTKTKKCSYECVSRIPSKDSLCQILIRVLRLCSSYYSLDFFPRYKWLQAYQLTCCMVQMAVNTIAGKYQLREKSVFHWEVWVAGALEEFSSTRAETNFSLN